MSNHTLFAQMTTLGDDQKQQLLNRDPKYKEADLSCLRAIAQAAINLELFTIPLYMTSMYSIEGLHQIVSKNNNFYEGRWWPGMGPVAKPTSANDRAFNKIFSVFIEEMLHLQLAANMGSNIGINPNFTSPALQNQENYAWICYGNASESSTVLPHILDFTDCIDEDVTLTDLDDPKIQATINPSQIKVKLDTLNKEQIQLFIAIESAESNVEKLIKPEVLESGKYFKPAPFDWWKPGMTDTDLPMFGSIGWLYTCYGDYLNIKYTDGTSMLDQITKNFGEQKDEFNQETSGHPQKEYPMVDATMSKEKALGAQFANMINTITDQGEGAEVMQTLSERWEMFAIQPPANNGMLKSVSPKYQPNTEALHADYPGYNDQGQPTAPTPSGQAKARIDAGAEDHFEIFAEVQKIIQEKDFLTWDMWHAQGNQWTAQMLNPDNTPSTYGIPAAEDVANALNNLKNNNLAANYTLLSKAGVGTIKGITTQLNSYWSGGDVKSFPSPAMYGSGDRLSICWAITGQVPKLWEGVASLNRKGTMYHACQGMVIDESNSTADLMPNVAIYHSCKGSNDCKTEGGCGFVHGITPGGNCGSSHTDPDSLVSIPANNKCGNLGGCAVPISESQLFPAPDSKDESKAGKMQVFNFIKEGDKWTPVALEEITYKKGDSVYGKAWEAYEKVMEAKGKQVEKPAINDLRLAFPPST